MLILFDDRTQYEHCQNYPRDCLRTTRSACKVLLLGIKEDLNLPTVFSQSVLSSRLVQSAAACGCVGGRDSQKPPVSWTQQTWHWQQLDNQLQVFCVGFRFSRSDLFLGDWEKM